MGIKGLMKWVEKETPDAIKKVSIKTLGNQKIAIDASLAIYQFITSIQRVGQQLTDGEGNSTSHLQGVLSRTVKLIEGGIKPVYVFDGKPPEMKGNELERRKERREEAEEELRKAKEAGDEEAIEKFAKRTVKLDQEQCKECQKLLELLGIPYVVAPCEAEAECAALTKAGKVDAMATEDMDSLAFATPVLLRHLTTSKKDKTDEVIKIDYNVMMEECGLTREQFVDFCILCGCDYCDRIKGIGPETAYKLIKEYKSIESIIEHIDQKKNPVPEDFDYARARDLFFNHPVSTDHTFKWTKPNLEELKNYMCEEKGFNESRIQSAYEKIIKSRKQGTQPKVDSFFKISSTPKKTVKKPEKKAPKKK